MGSFIRGKDSKECLQIGIAHYVIPITEFYMQTFRKNDVDQYNGDPPYSLILNRKVIKLSEEEIKLDPEHKFELIRAITNNYFYEMNQRYKKKLNQNISVGLSFMAHDERIDDEHETEIIKLLMQKPKE